MSDCVMRISLVDIFETTFFSFFFNATNKPFIRLQIIFNLRFYAHNDLCDSAKQSIVTQNPSVPSLFVISMLPWDMRFSGTN